MFEKKQVWWIECCTGCSCCANENFDFGFYLNEEEAIKTIERWSNGIGNPLASQYAKYGRYYLHSSEAEILPDGRMIIESSVFESEHFERIYW